MTTWTKQQLADWDADHAAATEIVARYCERMGYGKPEPREIWRGSAVFVSNYFCYFNTPTNHIVKVARDDRSRLSMRGDRGSQLYMTDYEVIDPRPNKFGWPRKMLGRRIPKTEW